MYVLRVVVGPDWLLGEVSDLLGILMCRHDFSFIVCHFLVLSLLWLFVNFICVKCFNMLLDSVVGSKNLLLFIALGVSYLNLYWYKFCGGIRLLFI